MKSGLGFLLQQSTTSMKINCSCHSRCLKDEELLKEDRDFIMRMMKLDPRDRPTAKDILQDEWLKS